MKFLAQIRSGGAPDVYDRGRADKLANVLVIRTPRFPICARQPFATF